MENAEQIAELAARRGWSVAAAESLTSGAVAAALGEATAASTWFRGGIVAYSTEVKRTLLDVDPGPVVSAECATQMARATARLLGADVAVATTGVGGPDPQDGRPPGTVFIAITTPNIDVATEHHFDGPPQRVIEQTVGQALVMLRDHLG